MKPPRRTETSEAPRSAGTTQGRLNFFVSNPDSAQARGLELAFASSVESGTEAIEFDVVVVFALK